jgi:hypothetical protein
MNNELKEKFKNVTAISFTSFDNDLIINFTGFEEEGDAIQFLNFVFKKIKMHNTVLGKYDPPTIH